MPETFKEFDALYKKCKPITKGAVKDATTYAKQLKYFRYDMKNALDALEDQVLEEKCKEDAIKPKKIEDYSKNRDIMGVLKAVNWNLDKMLAAYKDLDKMEKSAGFGKPNVKNLLYIQDEIIKARNLKKKNKEGKLDSNILKLENQVNDDLEQIMNFWDILDGITSGRRDDPQKEYDARIKYILKAKPKMSAKTQKYNELAPKMLVKRVMSKKIKECGDTLKAMIKQTDLALKAANDGNAKAGISNWQASTKELQKLQVIVKSYSDIKKKYPKEIAKSEGKKVIENSIARMENIEETAKKRWDATLEKINKVSKEIT